MSRTVLIAEDEPLMQDILADYLQFEGYETLIASNGMEVLELLQNHRVDLILLDVMMPGLDGFSVCRAIRKKRLPGAYRYAHRQVGRER